MILFANALLGVPLVKLVGAWMLIVIALNVRAQRGARRNPRGRPAGPGDFMAAAAVIMVADAAMSLDNVVALAAIAGGNLWLLAIGILLSIPILVYGAFLLSRILRLAPEIFTIGAAFLGWIAGGMATSDPLVAGWIDANAPALAVFAPALGALFVLAAGRGAPSPAAEPIEAPVHALQPRKPPPATLAAARPEALAVAAPTTVARARTRALCARQPRPSRPDGPATRHRARTARPASRPTAPPLPARAGTRSGWWWPASSCSPSSPA